MGPLFICYLLCSAMGEDPQKMKRHVTSTMIHLGHGVSVLGPLFARLKGQMMVYWSKPQDLRFICIKGIRKSLLANRKPTLGKYKTATFENSVGKLKLPRKLQRYIKFEEPLPYHQ